MQAMAFSDYLAIDAVNHSTLKSMRKSAKQYLYDLQNPRPDTSRLALGRGCHTAVLEPDRFMLDYVLFKGKVRRGKEWDAFKAQHSEDTILKLDEYKRCLAVRDAVRSNPVAASYLAAGEAEKSITWTDPKTGLPCKGRIDFLSTSRGALVDIKSTSDIRARIFARTAGRLGYHMQAAFYRAGIRVTTGKELPVVLITVEDRAPHDVAVYRMNEEDLFTGQCEFEELLALVAECRRTGSYPGVYDQEQELKLNPWDLGDGEDAGVADMGLEFGADNDSEKEDE